MNQRGLNSGSSRHFMTKDHISFLWCGSRAARVRTKINGIHNRLRYCAICTVYP